MLLVLGLTLSACLLAPGQFTSQLDIRKDGRFAFSYSGEIYLITLTKLAQMEEKDNESFEPRPCYDDDGEERECSGSELEEQESAWNEKQARAAEREEREAKTMSAMFGGIDPSDPEAAKELAERLSKQAGWKKVEYKGDGLFEVDFAISGRLDHDFLFPTVERFPANPFVQLALREDGHVRIDAPGYSASATGAGYGGFMQMAASEEDIELPKVSGRFILTTDAEILANNTEEGPTAADGGQQLTWNVSSSSAASPTALLKLKR